ncbi:hypothetical protein [Chamaesiphon polymorphus]|nr:hypothetical protein [Chamaesiphon polymorphus]
MAGHQMMGLLDRSSILRLTVYYSPVIRSRSVGFAESINNYLITALSA